MKTTTIYQQASTMLGAVILLLTVLCVLLLDIQYLTTSVRTIFVIAGITGGLLLMSSMTTKTTVEVMSKPVLPIKELIEQQRVIHTGNIKRLRQLEDDSARLARLDMRPDDTEAWERINQYILIQLGKEQNMLQGLAWGIDADSNKQAWTAHRNTVVQANNADKLAMMKENDVEDHRSEEYELNPVTKEIYWYQSDGTLYTISKNDWNKIGKLSQEYNIKCNEVYISTHG